MTLITFILRSSWRAIAIALITGFLSGGFSAGLLVIITRTAANSTFVTPLIAGAFVGLGLLALVTSLVSRIVLVRFSQTAVFTLQLRLSRQILATDLRQLESIGFPRLLALLTEDIQAISTAVSVVPILVVNLAILLGCMIYISWLSWQVLTLVLLLTGVASVSCRWFLVKGRTVLALARDQQDRLFSHFRALVAGIKALKLHAQRQQDFIHQDLQVTAEQLRQANNKGLSYFAVLDSWGKFIYFFAVGVVLFLLPTWMNLTAETRFGYVLTFTYLLGPMESVVNKLPFLGKANIALHRIETLGLSQINSEKPTLPPVVTSPWQQIHLKAATHTYRHEQDDSDFTLGPIDLAIYPGEIVFIIGGNGSGKSTLAKLITGLYIPESGEIWLDNQSISDDNRQQYRQYFATVFDDFFLFDRLLGLASTAQDVRAKEYLEKLHLDHKVSIREGRFSTTELSQGQRKRLALLTAYLEDRPIYLFDEWAADQDPSFKQIFYHQYLPELKAQGKAVIVISHDDHYFQVADRVVKLNYGQIESDERLT
ncbi:MAG: cyclic peptide export ABC transporter [Cyanobacteria bacterium J06635_15]